MEESALEARSWVKLHVSAFLKLLCCHSLTISVMLVSMTLIIKEGFFVRFKIRRTKQDNGLLNQISVKRRFLSILKRVGNWFAVLKLTEGSWHNFEFQKKLNVTVSFSVDMNAIKQSEAVKRVFHAKVGTKTLNFYDAQRLCALLGATLATYDQLYTAWEAGLQKCA